MSVSLPDHSRCVAQADVTGRWLSSFPSPQRSQSHVLQRWCWNINSIVTTSILSISTTTVRRKNNRKKTDLKFTLKFFYNSKVHLADAFVKSDIQYKQEFRQDVKPFDWPQLLPSSTRRCLFFLSQKVNFVQIKKHFEENFYLKWE